MQDTSTFELRRARIGVRGDVLPQVGYTVLWDGADASLKDAYGAGKNVSFLPGLEIRAGQRGARTRAAPGCGPSA